MSASGAKIGRGTTLAYFDGDGYTNLMELTKLGTPKQSVSDVKVTHFLSPAGTHEYIPGWVEPGVVEYEANYLKADRSIVQGMIGVPTSFTIALPDNATYVFPGYIKDVSDDFPYEDRMTSKVQIKVTGPVVFTPFPSVITLTSAQDGQTVDSDAAINLSWTTDTGYVHGNVLTDDLGDLGVEGDGSAVITANNDMDGPGSYHIFIRINGVDSNKIIVGAS